MSQNIHLGQYDVETVLNDGGVKTTSAAGQVASANKIVNLKGSRMDAKCIFNVSAITNGTGETFKLKLQASSSATFTGDIVDLAIVELAPAAGLPGDAAKGVGQYEVPFNNAPNGVIKPYVRAYHEVNNPSPANSPVASINYTAWLTV